MSSTLANMGLVVSLVSLLVSLGIAARCLYRERIKKSTALRLLIGPGLFSAVFALGVGLVMRGPTFVTGEVIIAVFAPLVPVIWAWIGYLALAEAVRTTRRSRTLFGLGLVTALVIMVYLYVSRPVFTDGVWLIGNYERWAFFILLTLGAWAMSYYERVFRWSAGGLRKKMLAPRIGLAILFTTWILTTGEGFFLGRVHASLLPWLALGQTVALVAVYRFSRFRADEAHPLSFSRQAAYSSAIVVMLGVSLIFLGIIGKVVQWIGGNLEAYLSVLAAFLAVFLLSLLIASPSVGRRLQRFVDRHFYKSRIDFAGEWAKITDNISGILDLPNLVKTVTGFLQEAFSDQVYIFLPAPEEGNFELYYPFGHEFGEVLPARSESADWLWRLGEPIFLTNWATQVSDPGEKKYIARLEEDLAGRIAVPLLARRRFLGFAVLGKRRDRADYDTEDFEFLAAMAGPVAFAVLTGQVSEELLAKREMESFNRVSTFVIHDLKNSVSMLSMLLQNAEKHMSDPAFQKSALQTVNDAVRRMQHLIGKISAGKDRVRSELKPVKLNETISSIIEQAGLAAHPRIKVHFDPAEIAPVIGDPIHVRRVLENLIVNAVEAMPDSGQLQITTGLRESEGEGVEKEGGPWVWVRVADSGCGMSREFITTRLFKPFESTKKKGLGIGMYQVKQMVEADGGRIQLESEPGKGTTFEVSWRSQRGGSIPKG